MTPLELPQTSQPARPPLSERVKFSVSEPNDILVIDGYRVSAHVLSEFTTVTPMGRWFRIVSREDGVITVETKQD